MKSNHQPAPSSPPNPILRCHLHSYFDHCQVTPPLPQAAEPVVQILTALFATFPSALTGPPVLSLKHSSIGQHSQNSPFAIIIIITIMHSLLPPAISTLVSKWHFPAALYIPRVIVRWLNGRENLFLNALHACSHLWYWHINWVYVIKKEIY